MNREFGAVGVFYFQEDKGLWNIDIYENYEDSSFEEIVEQIYLGRSRDGYCKHEDLGVLLRVMRFTFSNIKFIEGLKE